MNIALRDYQTECVETVLREIKEGTKKQLAVLPTGSGKTIVMAAIAKSLNKRTLLIAHREELITQAVDKFKLFWPEVNLGVCMAEKDEIEAQIVVGSVQSCSRARRLDRLLHQGFEVLMIDEAHHAISDSYQTIINELGFSKGQKVLLLGVTATPQRADKNGLGDTFEKLTFSRSISTMIKGGYLSPVVGRKILTNFNLEKINTVNGDFELHSLSEAVNTPERNEFIVAKFLEYSSERKGIAFCVDVEHCKHLAETFQRAGINALAIYGDMPTTARKDALESLKTGKIQIATSCGVLIEGFDEPSIDVVLMARPTKSQSLYIQCIGRGLRLWPGKESCLVLDFTDQGHNLDASITLNKVVPEAIHIKGTEEKAEIEEKKEIDHTRKITVLESLDKEFDVLGTSRFIWVSIGDDEWSLLDDNKREIVVSPVQGGYSAVLYYPDQMSRKIVTSPLPLEYCTGVCEDFARRHLKIDFADAKAPWLSAIYKPTQNQREFLEKNKAWFDGMSKAQATHAIRKIICLKNKQRRLLAAEPPSYKQIYALRSHGINHKGMNKADASQAIAKIKKGFAPKLQCVSK